VAAVCRGVGRFGGFVKVEKKKKPAKRIGRNRQASQQGDNLGKVNNRAAMDGDTCAGLGTWVRHGGRHSAARVGRDAGFPPPWLSNRIRSSGISVKSNLSFALPQQAISFILNYSSEPETCHFARTSNWVDVDCFPTVWEIGSFFFGIANRFGREVANSNRPWYKSASFPNCRREGVRNGGSLVLRLSPRLGSPKLSAGLEARPGDRGVYMLFCRESCYGENGVRLGSLCVATDSRDTRFRSGLPPAASSASERHPVADRQPAVIYGGFFGATVKTATLWVGIGMVVFLSGRRIVWILWSGTRVGTGPPIATARSARPSAKPPETSTLVDWPSLPQSAEGGVVRTESWGTVVCWIVSSGLDYRFASPGRRIRAFGRAKD